MPAGGALKRLLPDAGAVVMRQMVTLAMISVLALTSFATRAKQIAISVDDVPVASTVPASLDEVVTINEALLRVLKQHHARAIGFVNEDKLYRPGEVDARINILRSWLQAGMELGNHNFGHLGLWASSLRDVEDAVIKGEVITRQVTAEQHAPLRFYRPPYTQTGRDESQKAAFEDFLTSRGYRVAPFTIEHDDYLYGCVFDHARTESERRLVIEEYLNHLRVSVDVFEQMSQELFGRQIPHILLIHASRLNARSLDTTLSALESYGYEFISIAEAMEDPAYRSPDRASGRFGPSWLARWARAAGTKLTSYGQPDPTGWTAGQAQALCN